MKILITGGAGFIGTHLVRYLLEDGHKVVVLDDFSTGKESNLAGYKESHLSIINGSVLDKSILKKAAHGANYIFHLAAVVGVFNIIQKPIESMKTNIIGTENVLELAKIKKIPILITSSSEVYGKNISNKLSEDDDRIVGSPTIARWSYSESKAIDEFLAIAYHREYDLETRVARLFNTVGPGQLGVYGMVIPRFVSAALRGEDIEVFGTGEQTRCFTHVTDAVEALVAISLNHKTVGEIVNIGNTDEISISNLAQLIIEMTNSKSKIHFKTYEEAYDKNFEDMQRRVPSLEKIFQLTGWTPKRNLMKILEDVIEFESNQ